jgi:hypothetical protein
MHTEEVSRVWMVENVGPFILRLFYFEVDFRNIIVQSVRFLQSHNLRTLRLDTLAGDHTVW